MPFPDPIHDKKPVRYFQTASEHSDPLRRFMIYVIGTTLISGVIDVFELRIYLKLGHAEYRR